MASFKEQEQLREAYVRGAHDVLRASQSFGQPTFNSFDTLMADRMAVAKQLYPDPDPTLQVDRETYRFHDGELEYLGGASFGLSQWTVVRSVPRGHAGVIMHWLAEKKLMLRNPL